MPVVTDLYEPRQSWLHRLDPRVKVLFVACAIVLLLIYNNLFLMLGALLGLHLLHWSAGMPGHKIAFVWRALWPVSLMMVVLWTIFYPTGQPLVELWLLKITPLAMAQGSVLGLRILSMAMAVFVWLYTTDQPTLIRGLVKLKLPYEWGLTLSLALRYIPTFQGTYTLISEAQQARGLDISGSGFRRVRLMMPIFIAMIISSLRASEQLARALEARALGTPGVQRTARHDIHFRPLDYALMALILILTIGLLYLNLRYGFGELPVSLVVGGG